ncbi:MAG: nucleotidyl transferase AbiEii/AbiGii toxin family protein [Bacteroidetes bacterium]|nr:nucleotidyl transferase AbiEii/AbiGii toxin family protein [Bacteroidota bacterium]
MIKHLCSKNELSSFVLVGGTAMSLQIGHRKSIDIDLFSSEPFDVDEMFSFLESNYDYYNEVLLKNSLMGRVDSIKLDVITHQYKWLKPALTIEGVRMVSLEDIAAMKLNAIMGNGSRLKDYVDIAYLSSVFSLQQMLGFFEEKYPRNNSLMAFKSLSWFEDIDFGVEVLYMDKKMNWGIIQKRILEIIHNPQQVFNSL